MRRRWWVAGVAALCGSMVLGTFIVAAGFDDAASAPSAAQTDVPGIPPVLLEAYARAAQATPQLAPRCKGMRWSVLAGIGKVESDQAARRDLKPNGDVTPPILGPRLDGTNNTMEIRDTDDGRWDLDSTYDRAVGPLQFIPSTWDGGQARFGRDGNGDRVADPNNAYDAAYAAVVHLCGSQAREFDDRAQLAEALYRYNRVRSYVSKVLGWIDHYDQYLSSGTPLPTGSGKGATILAAAMRWQGTPYSWGGGNEDGPSYGGCCSPNGSDGSHTKGFDCSGLTLYALARIGIRGVQHSATWQWNNAERLGARRIPRSQGLHALKPGDLVWFSTTPANPVFTHHVGIYAGARRMINAPRPGTHVRLDPINPREYVGAARFS